jgi:HD superfamily phosphohydrolase
MKIDRPKSPEEAAAKLVREARNESTRFKGERDAMAQRLSELQSGSFAAVIKELSRHWLTSKVPNTLDFRDVDDPIYGHIVLDRVLATLVSHPLVQRLARVKQLSFSFAEFPSSRHSRLSHVLGVVKNAERALAGMLDRKVYYVIGQKQPVEFDENMLSRRREIIQIAQIAALLHDVGHGPFGHALDSYAGIKMDVTRPDKLFSEQYVREYFAPTLKSLGVDERRILDVLGSDRAKLNGIEYLIGDVIDSSLDVDRMDYLMRDAHMTGLMMGFINTSALIDFMRPVLDQGSFILAYDEAALAYMEHLILARDFMYVKCYEHPRKKAAERIFTRLVERIIEDPRLSLTLPEVFSLADEELTTAIIGVGTGNDMAQNLAKELMGDLDYVSVHQMPATSKEQKALPQNIEHWLKGVLIGENEFAYITQPSKWEEKIAQNSIGIDRAWQIQVILPDPTVYLQQHSATKLLRKTNSGYQTADFLDTSQVVKNILERMNIQRQKIMVMCPAKLESKERDLIKAAAEALFQTQIV